MAQRPGIMFYFSVRPALKRLNAEQKGQLFDAILDYGESGLLPDFDGVLGVCWDFIQPMIDKDAEAYREKCNRAKKAVETRWAREKDTDVYVRIPPNTEHTNNNDNYKNNFNSKSTTIANTDTMSAVGGIRGEAFASCDADADYLISEEKKRVAIQRMKDYGKGL